MNILAQLPITQEDRTAPWPSGEQRLLLHNISWAEYEMIGAALRDRGGIRLTYDRGNLEIMTTSREHERSKMWLGGVLEGLAEEFHKEIEPAGNMTFKRKPEERGLEPDQCYWIANEPLMRAKLTWDPDIDPPPDLFIEIEISRSFLDRMNMCATLGVPEIWCFDGETLRVYLLQPDCTYRESDSSPTFPGIALAGIVSFLHPSETMDYLSIVRAFRAWVREQLGKK